MKVIKNYNILYQQKCREISLCIRKLRKLHTISEELISTTAKAVVFTIVSEETANSPNTISLSNDTVK